MKIIFHLEWCQGSKLSFKQSAARELFFEYTERISKFTSCERQGSLVKGASERGKHWRADALWLCDRSLGARVLSSEAVATELSKILHSGLQSLHIVIGGPDGFAAETLSGVRPDLRWSFGALTLPHELAAVVAAEQLYRGWTQIKKLPYHLSHQ